jgi:hypothetical protein
MTVTEFLDEANVELATLQQVLDTAQHALDVADRTQRAGRRIRRLVRRLVVVAVVGLVGAGVAYGVKSVLDRRGATVAVASPGGPDQNGSVAPPADDADPTVA